MAVFLFGSVVGWIFTFALWFVWSFSLISGLVLGVCIGAITVFALLLIHWMYWAWAKMHNDSDSPVNKTARHIAKDAAFRS